MQKKTLDVFYRGKQVGTLAMTCDRRVVFQYSRDWLRDGFSISPLSLPLKEEVFVPKEKNRDIFDGLFGVFADSLPDNWGRLLLERYIEETGIRRDSITVLDRLAYVGASGMGALEYHPAKEKEFNVEALGLDYDDIAKECEKILASKTSKQLDLLYRMGGSSGGTRPKILLSEGGREWIIKFPSGNDPINSGILEYGYSVCAKACGIHMTETELVKSDLCDGYFKTERFDRVGNEKIMVITFAGVLEADYRAPSCDYAIFMKLVQVITKDNKADVEQLFKLMCFNVLTDNQDDHTKNFSFIYTEKSGFRLAPAYDLTNSKTYFGEHTTSVNGKGKNISDDDLIKVGTDAGLSVQFCKNTIGEIKEKLVIIDEYRGSRRNTRSGKMSVGKRIGEIVT